jgi:hypothetical protein
MSGQKDDDDVGYVTIADSDATLPPSLTAALKVINVAADDPLRCFSLCLRTV